MSGHLLLVSPKAGSTDGEALAAVKQVLDGAESAECSDAESLARALDRRDGRVPVVVGGDGSLHHVVAALHERGEAAEVPVGLVPLGTGNDFARGVGIPLDPAEAARVLRDGSPRSLDLLTDSVGGIVVNAVHVGVGASAARSAQEVKGVLGPLAFRVGGVVAGLRARAWPLAVEVDDEPLTSPERPVLMVALCNGPTVGGGTPLQPAADPGDGLVDVVATTATGLLGRVSYAADLRHGDHLERPDVTTARGRRVTLRSPTGPVELNADGELGTRLSACAWTVVAGAWSLFVAG